MTRGVFVTFEGGEGTGKTTQMALLAARLTEAGFAVTLTREPGGTALGSEIRRFLVCHTIDPPVPDAELLLYGADRAQHVAKVVRPALEKGGAVLCDRYADATVAYQGGGRMLDQELIALVNRAATGGLIPDRTILLDLEPGRGVIRALGREGGDSDETRFEEEGSPFHDRVRAAYLGIMAREPGRVRFVDASGTVAEVADRVWREVEDLFPRTDR